MSEFWEQAFVEKQLMWGLGPNEPALLARERFVKAGVKTVLIPGVGYGRNALPFLEAGMAVTGIEISATAIRYAREQLKLSFPIHHGSVADMPFDEARYDAVFCHGLVHLLDDATRATFLAACSAQLKPGGLFVCTALSKAAATYGRGTKHGEDRFEPHPGVQMTFFDEARVRREFGPHGFVEAVDVKEGQHPFFMVVCSR